MGYSEVNARNSDGQNADAFKRGRYASANLLYYPISDITAGIEWLWMKRENYDDGWKSSATKIQVSVRYTFQYKLLRD